MIRVPTLTDQHRQDHARVLIVACRLHPPPPASRDGHRIPCPCGSRWRGLLTDPRKPRGKRHPLPSPVSVMVAGVASGHGGALAVAQAASWDQDVLAGHGCRISPRTGLRVPPSARLRRPLPPAVRRGPGPAAQQPVPRADRTRFPGKPLDLLPRADPPAAVPTRPSAIPGARAKSTAANSPQSPTAAHGTKRAAPH
jgi:hypothetical protein